MPVAVPSGMRTTELRGTPGAAVDAVEEIVVDVVADGVAPTVVGPVVVRLCDVVGAPDVVGLAGVPDVGVRGSNVLSLIPGGVSGSGGVAVSPRVVGLRVSRRCGVRVRLVELNPDVPAPDPAEVP